MSESMALLSQGEIDTLVEFLTQQKKKVGMEVMDQGSINRLISLLHSNAVREVKYDTRIPEAKEPDTSAILLLEKESGLESQRQNCVLECNIDESSGYVKVICQNRLTGDQYVITPKCVEQVRYTKEDSSEWGYVVPPITFDQIAALLNVRYTKKTFDRICSIYSAKIFGSPEKEIPQLYMPTVYNLVNHLVEV